MFVCFVSHVFELFSSVGFFYSDRGPDSTDKEKKFKNLIFISHTTELSKYANNTLKYTKKDNNYLNKNKIR